MNIWIQFAAAKQRRVENDKKKFSSGHYFDTKKQDLLSKMKELEGKINFINIDSVALESVPLMIEYIKVANEYIKMTK